MGKFNHHKSNKGYIIFLMYNFSINNRYLYDRMTFIKKNTVINKIVSDFMDTLYFAWKYYIKCIENYKLKCSTQVTFALRPGLYSTDITIIGAATQLKPVSNLSKTTILDSDWLQLTGLRWVAAEITVSWVV